MVAQLARIGTAAALLVLLGTSSVLAGDKCRKACCPQCETCCELKIEEGTEEKHCWKTKEKTVCIPKVTFSWQWPFQKKKACEQNCDASCNKPCCAPPKLSRTRKVCTLVKETFECPVCKYKWVPKEETPCTTCEVGEMAQLGPVAPQPIAANGPRPLQQPAVTQQRTVVQRPVMSPQATLEQQPVAPIVSSEMVRQSPAANNAAEAAKPVSRPVVLRLSN